MDKFAAAFSIDSGDPAGYLREKNLLQLGEV
jgi:hypothetical protein